MCNNYMDRIPGNCINALNKNKNCKLSKIIKSDAIINLDKECEKVWHSIFSIDREKERGRKRKKNKEKK